MATSLLERQYPDLLDLMNAPFMIKTQGGFRQLLLDPMEETSMIKNLYVIYLHDEAESLHEVLQYNRTNGE